MVTTRSRETRVKGHFSHLPRKISEGTLPKRQSKVLMVRGASHRAMNFEKQQPELRLRRSWQSQR